MPFRIRPDDNSQITITKVYQAVTRSSLSVRALSQSLTLNYPVRISMISLTFYNSKGGSNINISFTNCDFNTIDIPYDMDLLFSISQVPGLNVEIVLTFTKLKTQED